MTVLKLENREAWLNARRANHGIGGSDVAAILGISPFAGPWDIYAERVRGERRSFSPAQQDDLDRGNRWEGAVLAEYCAATGNTCEVPAGHWLHQHPVEPWAIASPDALVLTSDATSFEVYAGGVEVKTDRNGRSWGNEGAVVEQWNAAAGESIPAYYATQAYWYLEATGLPWWDFAVCLPRRHDFPEVRTLRLMRDENTQQRLLNAVGDWRHKHLVQAVPPEVDASKRCRQVLAQQWEPQDKLTEVATDSESELAFKIAALKGQAKAIELEVTHAENRLAWHMRDRYGLTMPGSTARVIWYPVRGKLGINARKLEQDFPNAFEACKTRGNPSRVFRLYNFPITKQD